MGLELESEEHRCAVEAWLHHTEVWCGGVWCGVVWCGVIWL